MPNGTIFIQPHSDDAVMSSYFLMKAEVLPRPYYLLTVFGRSNWVDPIKGQKYRRLNASKVTHIRNDEDKRFAKLLRLKLLFLDFEDQLLRTGKVSYTPTKKLSQELFKEIRNTLTILLKEHNIKNVVTSFPSGTRQHYDHQIVCEVVKSLSTNLGSLFFVDDIPYSKITKSDENKLQLFTRLKGSLMDKFKAMKIYDSQMCKLFFNKVRELSKQNRRHERMFLFSKQ